MLNELAVVVVEVILLLLLLLLFTFSLRENPGFWFLFVSFRIFLLLTVIQSHPESRKRKEL